MFSQQSEGTNLSAEVPPFVPRRTHSNELGSHNSNGLPRYLTTCFPFVQEQQDRRHLNGSSNLHSLPVNPSHWPSPSLYGPAIVAPNMFAGRPLNVGLMSFTDTQVGNIADSAQSNAVYSTTYPFSQESQRNEATKSHSSKVDEKQKAKKTTKRNVGVQKEANNPDSDDDGAPKMKDNCQQTDFPISIASKSLKDKPSPLKKHRSRRSKVIYSTNDNYESSSDHADADVDSDSGYYSPKRRMHYKKHGGTSASDQADVPQASNSIHPIMFLPGNLPPSLLYPHSSSQIPSNIISPHPTPPPPNPASLLGFAPPDSSVLMPPPSSLMNRAAITSRPPPGFPIPPNMMKPPDGVQLQNGWLWNGAPCLPHNFAPPRASYPMQNSKSSNHHPRKQEREKAPSAGQGFQQKNRKQDYRGGSQDTGDHSHMPTPTATPPAANLILQDANEFPGLGSSSYIQHPGSGNRLSYSQALTQKAADKPQTRPTSGSSQPGKVDDQSQDRQKSRKRWKKAERASKAADEEYAEISKEQENMKKALKKTAASYRNRKQGNILDLGDIFSKLEAKSSSKIASSSRTIQIGSGAAPVGNRSHHSHHKSRSASHVVANPLDATAPAVRRGKERETPKVKKPSALKKVILKEREEKKEQRLHQLSTMNSPDHDVPPYPTAMLNPISANSSPVEDEVPVTPQLSQLTLDDVPSNIPQIHSRRYREYCCQVLDKKIDDTCTTILRRLVQFQERMYQRDPIKAKMRRRLVMGIREVTKHLKLKKLKCVIISPNLEKIQSKGGLDDALQQILDMCEEQNITYIFALGRKAMGRAVSKLVPVSIVGIFDYSGVDEYYKQLVSLVSDAQKEYKEMVAIYQQEVIKANVPTVTVSNPSSKRFAHMTHSRNPSAASCVSFASFISEPISEMNEESNWRVLMDAGEEPPLSPTAEAEGSTDEDGGVNGSHKDGEMSRKDSESTVVDCKLLQEQDAEKSGEVVKPCSLEKLSSESSSEYKDASSHNQFLESRVVSNVTTPESEKSPAQQAESGDPETTFLAQQSSLAIDEESTQDRIQMWLEDSQCSIPSEKDEIVDPPSKEVDSSKVP